MKEKIISNIAKSYGYPPQELEAIDNGRILFCKIGWANDYEGKPNDRPQGGGSYNLNNIGHETLNFKSDRGCLYGYVQHSHGEKASQINIEKIDLIAKGKESIDDTLVVWVANHPNERKIKIIGWYLNATVYRHPQECEATSERYNFFINETPIIDNNQKFQIEDIPSYRITAKEIDVTLLPTDERNFEIKKAKEKDDGGIGSQSAIWYAEKSLEVKKDVINYIYEFQNKFNNIETAINSDSLVGIEKERLVRQRCNQGDFRELMISKHKKCCLCGVNSPDLLVASHIKPWSSSTKFEKLDSNNGLLLCPNHDYVFDRGYISFDNQGKIIISDYLDQNNRMFLNINSNMQIKVDEEMVKYLKYHKENILRVNR